MWSTKNEELSCSEKGLLHLLLIHKNTKIIVIQSILNEIVAKSSEIKKFMATNINKIGIIKTSICIDDEAKIMRGERLGKRRGDLAAADFLLNYIDDEIDAAQSFIVFNKVAGRFQYDYPENAHLINTEVLIRKLKS